MSYFQNFYENVLPTFSSELDDLQVSLSKIKEVNIYNDSEVKFFLVNLLEINACTILIENPNYQGTDFDSN